MPLKLNVGASRKVTDNNYGSRGASVNLELELDAALVTEPAKLRDRIRDLFEMARAALAEELNGHGPGECNGHPPSPKANGREPHPNVAGAKGGHVGRNGAGTQPATPSQVRALYAIARSQGVELSQFLYDRFQLRRANDLSIRQASTAIDALKAVGAGTDG
jgi:hypothetical protein